MRIFSSIVFFLLAGSALGALYNDVVSYTGAGFLDAFSFEAMPDPTHGRVNYTDFDTACSLGLVDTSEDSFILRADSKTVLNATGPGRNSFRIQSLQKYDTHVEIFNIRHMPEGCGTWPAMWTLGDDWPNQGESDIVEGVNNLGTNQATLHTSPNCSMPPIRDETGTPISNDCDALLVGNPGCAVKLNETNSFGPRFNQNGGGWYAMERTSSFVKVWFWARDCDVPPDVAAGSQTINTDLWGTPAAYFPSTSSCDIDAHFGGHKIVINLTFCGDWAGGVYPTSGCPLTCVDYVNNYPSAFEDAYFDFAWLKIYKPCDD